MTRKEYLIKRDELIKELVEDEIFLNEYLKKIKKYEENPNWERFKFNLIKKRSQEDFLMSSYSMAQAYKSSIIKLKEELKKLDDDFLN